MPPDSEAPIDWRLGLLLFVAVLLLALPQAALMPLLDRDEPRFAEASREMLQSGNIVVPTFNNAPRYAKPPLIYWCQAVSFTLFGENAFAARLPSLLATAGTAWLLFAWCARLGSVEIGFSAAVSYALCLQTIQQGRVATADALLIFFMTLTAFAGWKLIVSPPASHSTRSYLWDTLLALGFAGGFLAKGPEAFLPLLPMLYCAWGVRKNLVAEIVANFLLGVVIVLFWAIPAYVETHGDYWRVGLSEGVGERMVSGLQGHGASRRAGFLFGSLFGERAALVAAAGDPTQKAFRRMEAGRVRSLFVPERGANFFGLHSDGDQAAPLHAPGVSVSRPRLRAALDFFRTAIRVADQARLDNRNRFRHVDGSAHSCRSRARHNAFAGGRVGS